MNPKILISVGAKQDNYVNAVNNCGGIAVAQYCPGSSADYDGLILCGGSDIDPKYYGEEVNGSVDIDVKRDEAEFRLVREFVEKKKPIMGICRGHQLLNVAFGGSLYQDISNAKEHSSFSDYDLVHKVTTAKDTLLFSMYGEEFFVNSFHHQAVKNLGEGFDVLAKTPDNKTIEAIVHRNLPILSMQWHPERMCFLNRREDTVDGSLVFDYFLRMCKEF